MKRNLIDHSFPKGWSFLPWLRRGFFHPFIRLAVCLKAAVTEKEHLSSAANPGDGVSSNQMWFQVEHVGGEKNKKKMKQNQKKNNQKHQ